MKVSDSLRRVWWWVRWPLFVLAAAYAALVVWDVNRLFGVDKTNAAVAAIHAQKLTLQDVLGTTIDYPIDEAANNATVAGIDSNNNGIRDDVEVALFKKYPADKKARAAALQYAMTEQMFLTRVFDTETWKAVAEEDSRANRCASYAKINTDEVEKLVFNSKVRSDALNKAMEFITSFGSMSEEPCDVLVQ